jgi:putative spermidine/putrescine transport system permease protein
MTASGITRAGGRLLMAAVALFMLAPLVVVVLVSFSSSPVFNLPAPEWSLRWYQGLARKDGLGAAVWLSLQVAVVSTIAALVLGTLCAVALVRGSFRGRDALLAFMVSPLMMPGLVVGVALLQALRELGLRDAWLALMIGHIVVTLPYVTRTVHGSLLLFDVRLLEAARTLGLSPVRAAWKVLVPSLAPAFLTSGLFAFLASMDNYPISIFLTDARNKTLPIEILRYLEESPDPTIAALSSCLIVFAVAVLLAAERLVGLRRLAQF